VHPARRTYSHDMAHAIPLAPRRLPATTLIPGAGLVVTAWIALAVLRDHRDGLAFAGMWLAMTVAMMLPTVLRPMRRAADGSLARAGSFALGFVLVWAASGAPAYVVMGSIDWTPGWIAAVWVLAGAYQLTPWMFRNLTTCRSVGYGADPLRYGVRQGVRCVASCWPLMVAVMVSIMAIPGTVMPLLALVAVTALLCWEKRPGTSPRLVAAIGMAMLLVAVGGVVLAGGSAEGHHSSATSTS
jgi:predicted metal-binding membrane protein